MLKVEHFEVILYEASIKGAYDTMSKKEILLTLIQSFSRQKHDLKIRLPYTSKTFKVPSVGESRFLSKTNGPV